MKISEILSQAKKELSVIDGEYQNISLDVMMLLIFATGLTKEQIVFSPDREINFEQEKLFSELIKRRKNREPISHLIGNREFFGRDFFVNSNVLDPRPDSETLIELALKYAKKDAKILEIGVGSGCLIITLLKELKESVGVGLDLSKKALEVAQRNAAKHGITQRLQFLESNLFESLLGTRASRPHFSDCGRDARVPRKFDLIISNPPYIPSAEIENLQDEVKNHEPRMALDGGTDGFDFYRKIAAKSKDFLNKNGAIIVEIGFGQKEEIEKIFAENGFTLREGKKDLGGIDRALCLMING